ncbi:MAG: antitoxin MazE family protein [Candidatus Thioglobus sp.]|jgi:hypothetical protein|nr:antitoxin MazE family protein [Candidatus Thioglobus sp.]MBT6966368.1 antitoxin MazE family protein [Candidatus Thioglobus sp.]
MNVTQRVNSHRNRLREQGLRPIQIWIPDARRDGFAQECQRQSQLLQNDAHEHEISSWIEQAADQTEWR